MKDKDFGIRLKSLRKKRNLTQIAAAQAIGLSYKALQDHEAGNQPNQNNLNKYITFYNCSKNWLLTGISIPEEDKEYTIQTYSKKVAEPNEILEKTKTQEVDGKEFTVTTFEPETSFNIVAAINQLDKILKSGNQILIRAIISNLEAFCQSVDQQDRIEALENECDKLKARVEALEVLFEKSDIGTVIGENNAKQN